MTHLSGSDPGPEVGIVAFVAHRSSLWARAAAELISLHHHPLVPLPIRVGDAQDVGAGAEAAQVDVLLGAASRQGPLVQQAAGGVKDAV